ncbi:MAG: bifunctional 4-hydroxy-2-oxoglutarate aldolase/2-dehydro-3-deoxy-phosphogluconate aldolase [Nitrospinales bacterium]
MSSKEFDLSRFEEEPVLGIVRGLTEKSLEGVMEAAIAAELRHIEITLNTSNAFQLIEEASKKYGAWLCIGAGTVLSSKEAEQALFSGAKFIVAPTLNADVASFCRDSRLAYFPGALTPTEIEKAWNSGAAMVKVFPTSSVTPKYFKEVRGPFQNYRLMATGGVNKVNVEDYLSNGASAVAVGDSIFSLVRMENQEFDKIRKDLEDLIMVVKNFFL